MGSAMAGAAKTALVAIAFACPLSGGAGRAGDAGPAPPLDAIRVDPATGHFVDSHGRTRLFHGVNVVYKIPPWYPPSRTFTPTDSLDPETAGRLREWGFNVVRLGVMWPGVEPKLAEIDGSYLRAIAELAESLARHGVYTLADLHQDLGSRRFCGEGFPEHYVDALLRDPSSKLAKAAAFPSPMAAPMALNGSGFPFLDDCLKSRFAMYYMTYAVGALWQEFYTPGSDLNSGFLRFWGAVANAFANVTHVIGYELLNEPTGLCLGGDIRSCIVSGVESFGDFVEAKFLTPLYRAAAKVIRSAGAAQPIFYEPTVIPKVPISPLFPELPLGDDAQQVFAYHVYCAPGDGAGAAAGKFCELAQDVFWNTYQGFLQKHKRVGGFMTEFGAVGGNDLELSHLDRLLGYADDSFQSWAYWQLKKYEDYTSMNSAESLYNASGTLEVSKLKALSRTYAPAIGGLPRRMAFNPSTAAFELEFNATVTSAPTEVYLNTELHYPSGHEVVVRPSDCLLQRRIDKNYIQLSLPENGTCRGQLVTISVKAAVGSPQGSVFSVVV